MNKTNGLSVNSMTIPHPTSNPRSNAVKNEIAGPVRSWITGSVASLIDCSDTVSGIAPSSITQTPSRFDYKAFESCPLPIQPEEPKSAPIPLPAPSQAITEIGLDPTPQLKIECANSIDTESLTLTSDSNFNIEPSNSVSDFSSLNRSDVAEVFQHKTLLSPCQLRLIESVRRKQQLFPLRYRDDYLRQSFILLLSNGWSSALRYSMCSVPNSVNRSGQCKLHKYCPYCSFLTRQQALAKYVPVYDSGVWHFLTGSFVGDLKITSTSSYYDAVHYWDAYKQALFQLVRDGLVRGVFWTEELAVNSIAPVHVLPHIHALIEANGMSADVVEALRTSVITNLKATIGPDHLMPNFQVKSLNSQRKLLSHIQYQVKPLQIVKAYDLAWSRAVHNDRQGAVQLNSDTTDLVLGYSMITKDRTKLNYAGNLSPKCKVYIGTRNNGIKNAYRKVAEVMKLGADYVALDEEEGLENGIITATE